MIYKFVFSVRIIQQVTAGIIYTVGVAINGIHGIIVAVCADPNGIGIRNFHGALGIGKQHTAALAGIVGNVAVSAASGLLCRNQSQGMHMIFGKQDLQFQNLRVGFAILQVHDPVGFFLCCDRQLINRVIPALPGVHIVIGSGIADLSGAQSADHQLAAFGKRQNTAFGNWHVRIVVIGIDHGDIRHLGLIVSILIQRRDPLGLNSDLGRDSGIVRTDFHNREANTLALYSKGEVAVLIGVYDLIEKVCVSFVGREDDPSSGHRIAESIQESTFQSDRLCGLHCNVGVGHVDLADILLDGQLLGGVLRAEGDACVVLHRAVHRHLHGADQQLTILTGDHQLAAIIDIRIGGADFFVG